MLVPKLKTPLILVPTKTLYVYNKEFRRDRF